MALLNAYLAYYNLSNHRYGIAAFCTFAAGVCTVLAFDLGADGRKWF